MASIFFISTSLRTTSENACHRLSSTDLSLIRSIPDSVMNALVKRPASQPEGKGLDLALSFAQR
jgi:hypothetical protein